MDMTPFPTLPLITGVVQPGIGIIPVGGEKQLLVCAGGTSEMRPRKELSPGMEVRNGDAVTCGW